MTTAASTSSPRRRARRSSRTLGRWRLGVGLGSLFYSFLGSLALFSWRACVMRGGVGALRFMERLLRSLAGMGRCCGVSGAGCCAPSRRGLGLHSWTFFPQLDVFSGLVVCDTPLRCLTPRSLPSLPSPTSKSDVGPSPDLSEKGNRMTIKGNFAFALSVGCDRLWPREWVCGVVLGLLTSRVLRVVGFGTLRAGMADLVFSVSLGKIFCFCACPLRGAGHGGDLALRSVPAVTFQSC
ncbi:hypothetical protein C8R45DRAFT_403049 [Mycena sanguinolenta]|nr:hypothetical protein C8R45DRAFT_403049 [Mycena sanguinolenta]